MNNKEIYHPSFVTNLFNSMSKTYGIVNYLSSFGFTERWRRQCVEGIEWEKEVAFGYDLMSGMGECWGLIFKASKKEIHLIGVDISPIMNQKAREKYAKMPFSKVEIREENILENNIPSNSADFITSAFGLKTFSEEQLKILAKEVLRILKKGGEFSFIEVSKPKNILLKIPFLFYLNFVIPIIGKLFMGNSSDYQMLGIYCEKFGDCRKFGEMLERDGAKVIHKNFFFGCATGIIGYKI